MEAKHVGLAGIPECMSQDEATGRISSFRSWSARASPDICISGFRGYHWLRHVDGGNRGQGGSLSRSGRTVTNPPLDCKSIIPDSRSMCPEAMYNALLLKLSLILA